MEEIVEGDWGALCFFAQVTTEAHTMNWIRKSVIIQWSNTTYKKGPKSAQETGILLTINLAVAKCKIKSRYILKYLLRYLTISFPLKLASPCQESVVNYQIGKSLYLVS